MVTCGLQLTTKGPSHTGACGHPEDPAADLNALGGVIGRVAESVGPAVVGLGRGFGPGSGVVLSGDRVLTAAFGSAEEGGEVRLGDGRRQVGRQVVSESGLGLAFVAAEVGDVRPVRVAPPEGAPSIGTPVVALADPGGRGLRATLGFVASLPRAFRGPRGSRIEGAIEHTAPLPRGSSGGPLVDLDGRLVGINVLRREGGLILAVPASAKEVERLGRIERGEEPGAPRLGVALAPPRVARRLRRAVGLSDRQGLLVRGVAADSPAAHAGLTRGDLLVTAGGRELGSTDDLVAELERAASADGALVLGVVRGEVDQSVTARVGEAAGETRR